MGVTPRLRRGLAAGLLAAAALAGFAWAAAPLVMGRVVDRGLKDLRRHQDVIGTHGGVERDGFGFALGMLAFRAPDGTTLATVERVSAKPVAAWPPLTVAITGARVTQPGIDAYARVAHAAKRPAYRTLRSGLKRQRKNLGAGSVAVALEAITVERPDGFVVIRDAALRMTVPSPDRAVVTIDRAALALGTAGTPVWEGVLAGAAGVEITQDAATLRLDLESRDAAPAAIGEPLRIDAFRRWSAPGWEGVTPVDARWEGHGPAAPLARALLGWPESASEPGAAPEAVRSETPATVGIPGGIR